MEVDDAVERFVGGGCVVLGRDPVPDGAEVVAQMDLAGGLDAREHARHGRVRLPGGRAGARPHFQCHRPGGAGTLDPDVVRGPHARLRGPLRPPPPPHPPKQEVELWEVSLSEIVDAYLAELDRMETLDLDVATEFLLIAATLVELKARRLLPGLEDLELDEELLRFEERDLLLARLLECKTFKDAARALERGCAAPTAACPAAPAPRSRTAGWCPTRSSGCAGGVARRRAAGAVGHARRSSSTPTTSRRCARACATRSRRCCACCPSPSR